MRMTAAHLKDAGYEYVVVDIEWYTKGAGSQRDRYQYLPYSELAMDEQRMMMTLWCLFGSPLIIGAELTKLDDWTLALLTNPRILAMHTPDCVPRQIFRDDTQAI